MNTLPLIPATPSSLGSPAPAGAGPDGAAPPPSAEEFRRALGRARENAGPRRATGSAPGGTVGNGGPAAAGNRPARAGNADASAGGVSPVDAAGRAETAEPAEGGPARRGAARPPAAGLADDAAGPAAIDAAARAAVPSGTVPTGAGDVMPGMSPRTTPAELQRGGTRGAAARAGTGREAVDALRGRAGVEPGDDAAAGRSGTAGAASTADAAFGTLAADAGAAAAGAPTGAATPGPVTSSAPPVGLQATQASTSGTASPADAAALPHEIHLPTGPGRPDFAAAIGVQISVLVRDGIQAARLQLNPAELGPVTVQLALDGTAAQLHLAAEQAPTRQALEQALPVLAGALREAGFTLSGGGVFEQPRQDRGPGQAPDDARRAGSAPAAPGAGPAATDMAPLRRRGVVDLVA
jgi:flagellar hook-length control protein FliK